MKAYKGFDKDLKCRGFQYEIGGQYKEEKAELCDCGFHACENPLDVFNYYPPATSRFCEVELDGVTGERRDDSKVAGSAIKVGTEIGIPGLVRAFVEYTKSKTTFEHTDPKQATAGYKGAATAGDSGAATAGYKGAATAGTFGAATAGDSGAATAGDSGAATAGTFGAATAGDSGAATAGYKGAATAGDSGAATAGTFGAATAGDSGAATAGYKGAATAGDFGAATAGYKGAATAGDFGAATSGGSVSVGENGVGLVRGSGIKAKGGLGATLVIAVENDNFELKEWKAFVVDGEIVKADTWYTLNKGELEEVVG